MEPPSHFDEVTVEESMRRKVGKQIVPATNEISCDGYSNSQQLPLTMIGLDSILAIRLDY